MEAAVAVRVEEVLGRARITEREQGRGSDLDARRAGALAGGAARRRGRRQAHGGGPGRGRGRGGAGAAARGAERQAVLRPRGELDGVAVALLRHAHDDAQRPRLGLDRREARDLRAARRVVAVEGGNAAHLEHGGGRRGEREAHPLGDRVVEVDDHGARPLEGAHRVDVDGARVGADDDGRGALRERREPRVGPGERRARRELTGDGRARPWRGAASERADDGGLARAAAARAPGRRRGLVAYEESDA